MTESNESAEPSMEPGSRSGEGSASVLPHLVRQQQSSSAGFPKATTAELEAAARNAAAMADLLHQDYLQARARGDAARAEALALDLKTLREMAGVARRKLAAALEADAAKAARPGGREAA